MAQYSSPLPDYLAMWTHERKTYPGDMADGELLEELTEEDGTYDAFEKDIAALNFFYGDPEFVGKYCSSQPSMVRWLSSSIFPCWLFVPPW